MEIGYVNQSRVAHAILKYWKIKVQDFWMTLRRMGQTHFHSVLYSNQMVFTHSFVQQRMTTYVCII